jgi:hypothetical protein
LKLKHIDIHGVSNYPVKISSSQSDGLATVLYMFDSGDGGGCEGMPGEYLHHCAHSNELQDIHVYIQIK